MALKLTTPTHGKQDVFRFNPADLIPNFQEFTGRVQRTDDDIEEMIQSLLNQGQINPFTYRKGFDGAVIPMSGHTRILAANQINVRGLKDPVSGIAYGPEKPFLVKGAYFPLNDLEALLHTFTENSDATRKSMTGMDIAYTIRTLISNFGLNQTQVAEKLRLSPSQVTNYLKFLELDSATQQRIINREINDSVALTLVSIAPEDRGAVVQEAASAGKKITASAVKKAARSQGARTSKPLAYSLPEFRRILREYVEKEEDAATKLILGSLADGIWKGDTTPTLLVQRLRRLGSKK